MYRHLLYANKDNIKKACYNISIKLYRNYKVFYKPYILIKITNIILKKVNIITINPIKYICCNIIIYSILGYLRYYYTVYFINITLK